MKTNVFELRNPRPGNNCFTDENETEFQRNPGILFNSLWNTNVFGTLIRTIDWCAPLVLKGACAPCFNVCARPLFQRVRAPRVLKGARPVFLLEGRGLSARSTKTVDAEGVGDGEADGDSERCEW